MTMRKLFLTAAASIAVLFLVLTPVASAHEIDFFKGLGYWGGEEDPILTCKGGSHVLDDKGDLQPNKEECDVCELIHTFTHIAFFVLSILVFVAIPILLMWGGFLILISQGSSEKIGEGKKIISGAAIGVALGLGAYIIVNTFLHFLAPSVGGESTWGSFSCEDIKNAAPFLFPPKNQ